MSMEKKQANSTTNAIGHSDPSCAVAPLQSDTTSTIYTIHTILG